jgi:phosphohistidine phosphatase
VMSGRYAVNLYFLRHGEAADAHVWAGDDFDRPLTEGGRERMAFEAEAIKRLDLALDCIVTSPLVRARQTAAIVADTLQMREALFEEKGLGATFDLDQLANILHTHAKARAVMFVGHEPSLSATIGRLIGGAVIDVKKGSLARVDVSGTSELRGKLMWLAPPRVLVPGLQRLHSRPGSSIGEKDR